MAKTLRAALDGLATATPDWFERYERMVEDCRLPKRRKEREALALVVGANGFLPLGALDVPVKSRTVLMVSDAARRVAGALRARWRRPVQSS